jgi:hypothetical protein
MGDGRLPIQQAVEPEVRYNNDLAVCSTPLVFFN